jgi:hypothetical protein
MTTKITPSVLANTAVTSGSYGDAATISSITIDSQGRITAASESAVSIDTAQLTSGTIADVRLANKVSATSTGSATQVSRFTVDDKGRITSANSVAIAIPTSQITNYPSFVASATTDTTNANNISSGTLAAARLAISGVTATSVGSTGQSARFTVDNKGRITSANSIAISIASGAVTGLANSATTDTTNADNITSGTLNRDRLPATGVAAISFGGQAVVPRYTLDATGRITSANNIAIAINAGAVTGLAGVATSGSYNDLSNRPTIPTVLNTLSAAYPVGSVYLNVSNSADPSTLLGFGTWVAIANSNFSPVITPLYVWKRTV